MPNGEDELSCMIDAYIYTEKNNQRLEISSYRDE